MERYYSERELYLKCLELMNAFKINFDFVISQQNKEYFKSADETLKYTTELYDNLIAGIKERAERLAFAGI